MLKTKFTLLKANLIFKRETTEKQKGNEFIVLDLKKSTNLINI